MLSATTCGRMPHNALSPYRRPLSALAVGTVKGSHARNQRGVAAVELAIVLPIFLMMVFGMIELGRAFMVQQIITNASREGARRAIIEDATVAEVQSLVQSYLGSTSVQNGATIQVSPGSIGSNIGFGDPITVSVSVPYSSVSWLPASTWMSGVQLSATSVMRAERPQ